MSIFTKQIIKQTTGNPNSSSQAFLSNQYAIPKYPDIPPFIFDVPTYSFTGGTLHYYEQDPNSIFTSLSVPLIRYHFTGNTFSLSGDTLIIHEIYKIRNSTFKQYNLEFERGVDEKQEGNTQYLETETITDENGVTTTRTISRNSTTNTITNNYDKIGNDSIDELIFELTTPVKIFSGATSGITSFIYDFTPDPVIKASGSSDQILLSEKLFDDRSQYFIKTYFRFSKNTTEGYFDEKEFVLDSQDNPIIVTASTPSPQHLFTGVESHVITATTFSGYTIGGNYFSYFEVPAKPKMEQPYVSGQLDTFTPEFYFSNIEDGDEYTIDVSYDLVDTGFTGTIYTSKIPKNLSTEGVQYFSTALRNGKDFAYRVGNIKILKNIFGVEQRVVTYSDTWTARTQTDPVSIFVFSSSDSPYITDLPVLSSPPNINIEPIGEYSFSGLVSGSIVTGATVYLTYPNGNIVETTTDETGYYTFNDLEPGTYTATTVYRGYETNNRTIYISGNTSDSYKLVLVWGNEYDTFGHFEDEQFGSYE